MKGEILNAQLLTEETILAPITRPLTTENGVNQKKNALKRGYLRFDDSAQEDESQKLCDLWVAHDLFEQNDQSLQYLVP